MSSFNLLIGLLDFRMCKEPAVVKAAAGGPLRPQLPPTDVHLFNHKNLTAIIGTRPVRDAHIFFASFALQPTPIEIEVFFLPGVYVENVFQHQ